jgi:hypothetical protein
MRGTDVIISSHQIIIESRSDPDEPRTAFEPVITPTNSSDPLDPQYTYAVPVKIRALSAGNTGTGTLEIPKGCP